MTGLQKCWSIYIGNGFAQKYREPIGRGSTGRGGSEYRNMLRGCEGHRAPVGVGQPPLVSYRHFVSLILSPRTDSPDFSSTAWAKFQTHLEELIPFDPELDNEMAIDTFVENFSGAVLKALPASTPKRRPSDNPRPPIPAGIQDEILLKNRLRRQWQLTRDPALKVEINRLQRSVTRKLNELRNGQWITIFDPSIVTTNRCGG